MISWKILLNNHKKNKLYGKKEEEEKTFVNRYYGKHNRSITMY